MRLPIPPPGHNLTYLLNNYMEPEQKFVDLVNYMLSEAAHGKKFSSTSERILWERGFLTGLLASLARDESDVHLAIRRKIKKR